MTATATKLSLQTRLILENRMGQKVRSFHTDSNELSLIFRLDTRRVELHANLLLLEEEGIEFKILKNLTLKSLEKGTCAITGVGILRLADENEKLDSPRFELSPEEDKKDLILAFQRSSAGHVIGVALLIGLSFLTAYFAAQKQEPNLVTITLPPPPEKIVPPVHVKAAEKKIQPITNKKAKVAEKTVTPKHPVVKNQPKHIKVKSTVAVAKQVRNLERVGALAALGGLKNGAKNAEGLDLNSMKNIRSAGVGNGGGGIGDAGSGGARGMLPGQGLIAGSTGSGGKAQSAGGYGTKGSGGGKAGYGKISLVGGTSGVVLSSDEEASVEGGLDMDQIQAVINRNKGQIVYCYEQGVQRQPDLRGRVSVQFVIGPSGRITMAQVAHTSLRSAAVESCMVAKMRTWQFPHPVGNVSVDVLYPFNLQRLTSR